MTAKDKCDSSTFDISVEGACVEKQKTTVPVETGFYVQCRYDEDPNVLLLLSLQSRNRRSRPIFCRLSRGRKCSGGGVKCCDKEAKKKK